MHDMTQRIDELAQKKLDMRLGVGRELKKLPSLLLEAEEVLNLARGRYDGKEGLIVLTDRRILFVEEGMMRSRLEDFPYGRVSSIQSEKGFVNGKLIVFASGNKAEITHIMPKERATEIGDYVRARISDSSRAVAAAPAQAAAGVADDPYEQLRKLGELRDAGVLSDEEFAGKKASILSRI